MPELYVRTFPIERIAGGQASGVVRYNAGNIAPHAQTQRWAYTVPTNVAARIEAAFGIIMRDAVAAPSALAYVYITAAAQDLIYLPQLDNTLGARAYVGLGECGFLAAGEQLLGFTADASTGGTYTYTIAARYRQFAV